MRAGPSSLGHVISCANDFYVSGRHTSAPHLEAFSKRAQSQRAFLRGTSSDELPQFLQHYDYHPFESAAGASHLRSGRPRGVASRTAGTFQSPHNPKMCVGPLIAHTSPPVQRSSPPSPPHARPSAPSSATAPHTLSTKLTMQIRGVTRQQHRLMTRAGTWVRGGGNRRPARATGFLSLSALSCSKAQPTRVFLRAPILLLAMLVPKTSGFVKNRRTRLEGCPSGASAPPGGLRPSHISSAGLLS
ncbi:hypothetical protein Aduo_005247 [Ancylostoma duodenale]